MLKIMKPVVQYGGHDELISQHTKLITAFTSLYKQQRMMTPCLIAYTSSSKNNKGIYKKTQDDRPWLTMWRVQVPAQEVCEGVCLRPILLS